MIITMYIIKYVHMKKTRKRHHTSGIKVAILGTYINRKCISVLLTFENGVENSLNVLYFTELNRIATYSDRDICGKYRYV